MKFIINNRVVLSRPPEGPLASHIVSFAESVSEQGYAVDSVHRQVLLAACFSRWLKQTGVEVRSICADHPVRYLRCRARHVRPCRGDRLSVHGVQYLLTKHRMAACKICPSLKQKRVTVHRLRHTMAMDLLQAGVDRSVIALWLGHESVETTQIYLEATLAMKEQALAKTSPPHSRSGRYQPGDQLLGFLNSL